MQTAASIPDTFRDGTVMITGGTGFLGKVLAEKLLRSCQVRRVAVLVRSKRGFDACQRATDVFKQTVFDRLREEKPDFINYIKIIGGDLQDLSTSLSSSDRNWIVENVNFLFHCAATVKFNEHLELATKINIQGTINLLGLAREMKNLKGFVHVSTAYSHCPRDEIKEQFYPVPVTANELKTMTDIDNSSSKILKDWPNTYSFTKAIAENEVLNNGHHLPISVFRPSIIGCTHLEPNPGWIGSMNGPSGIITGFVIGFLRTFPIRYEKVTDIVPADYTVNALISVMWATANRTSSSNKINEKPKIYNYVSSVESPLTWGNYINEIHSNFFDAPPLQSMWYPFYVFYSTFWTGMILKFFLHIMPAAFVDFLLYISCKKPKILKMYAKADSVMDMLQKFSTKEWKFDNSNTRELWASLSQEDRKSFWFSLENFDWKSFIKSYYYGIRKHLLHEDMSNKSKALSKYRKLFWLHHLCIFFICYLVFQLCWLLISYLC